MKDRLENISLSEEQLGLLKECFQRRPEIAMAFIFGSFAKGQPLYDSDVDIAVYFRPKERRIEWEETGDYPQENEIWEETEQILGRDVDLLVLNRASSLVAYNVLQDGLPIIINDRALYWRFYALISRAALDFGEFVKDYWMTESRSGSLNELDKIRLVEIIKFLTNELSDYELYLKIDWQDYQKDRVRARSLEHWIENIVNASIDAARILLASKKRRLPQTYKEILKSLALLEGFEQKIAEELSEFAKLRNMIAHEYLDIRFREIQGFLKSSKPLYDYLLGFVKDKYLS